MTIYPTLESSREALTKTILDRIVASLQQYGSFKVKMFDHTYEVQRIYRSHFEGFKLGGYEVSERVADEITVTIPMQQS